MVIQLIFTIQNNNFEEFIIYAVAGNDTSA